MKILAIETSCDETGIALLEASGGLTHPRFRVLKSLVSSQIKIHRPFGGVVPNLAKREHLKNLPVLYGKIFGKGQNAKRLWQKIEFITVTVGPGLEPALWTGIEFAKSLAKQYKKPLIGANHLEGHLYSFLLPPMESKAQSAKRKVPAGNKRSTIPDTRYPRLNIFPSVALIVSGGHTNLLRMDSFSKWRRLGETRDDAAGEAFDKVARLLELPYPGGPEIEKIAKQGDPASIAFPRPMINDKSYDFSFSGLKTAVLYRIAPIANRQSQQKISSGSRLTLSAKQKADIAASFQQAAMDVLIAKTLRAARIFNAKSAILCGGVAANKALRNSMHRALHAEHLSFLVPEFKYNLDNAAMIGAAGYMAFLRKKKYPIKADGTMQV